MTEIRKIISPWCACVLLVLCSSYLNPCSAEMKVTLGYIDEDKQTVKQMVDDFHTHLSNEKFQVIYSQMHATFQASESKEEHIKRLAVIADQYGKTKAILDSRIEIIIGAPVQARAVYNTKFEKNDATEMFTFVKNGSSFKLAQYGIWAGFVIIPKGL